LPEITVKIIYTCGDPLSINVEAFLKVIAPARRPHDTIIGIGSKGQLAFQSRLLNIKYPEFSFIDRVHHANKPGLFWIDSSPESRDIDPRQLNEQERGTIAKASLDTVPTHANEPMAILTAPIDKKSISIAGFKFPGQTEYFEHLWSSQAVMMLAGPKLRVALATNHLKLSDVTGALTSDVIFKKIELIHKSCQKLLKIAQPRIAVCGLNPHCGDHGLFGSEETSIIAPAITRAIETNINASGPYPADTVFYRAFRGDFDVVLAMYHDQGLGPLKSLHFDEAVNISMGLPHLRVSPDHGPAADLFLTGRANFTSFENARDLCFSWLSNHQLIQTS
jgi:4-hydroxythreonine-4-phosphate dehydrogenase